MESSQSKVFDQIAPSWYHLRHLSIFRPELEKLALRWQKGRLVNLGCGHGADFLPFIRCFELYGVDISPEMIAIAQKYSAKHNFEATFKVADIRELPFADGFFDWAVAVAVFHHIESDEGRVLAFEELHRVLRRGGEAFITVWNHGQPRFRHHPREMLVPWRLREKTVYRYYYLFSYGEVERLAKKTGFEVLEARPEARFTGVAKAYSRNICLLVRAK